MNIIKDNPFRILGVFSNASAKEIAANTHRISAYQRVNREVSFTSDLPNLVGTCDRNEKAVADAQAKINLPNDKIRYALFWFVKGDDADEIVMRHLAAGNIDKAKQILGMGRIFSFKINLGIISLIQGNYKTGITQITSVIDNDNDRTNFVKSVCGETFQIDKQTLKDMFVDGMLELVPPEQLLNIYKDIYNDPVSTKRIKDKVASQYLDKIDSEIATAQKVDQNDSAASYNAGVRLVNNTKSPLQKLKDLMGVTDMQYKRTADQLANQILQCGINYYNNISSPTRSVVKNAMTLQRFAAQIAVGQLAKDRCGKNIDILNKTLENMPPEGVEEEVNRIINHLSSYRHKIESIPDEPVPGRSRYSGMPFYLGGLDDSISQREEKNKRDDTKVKAAKDLLELTKKDMQAVKSKLGKDNTFYLKLSTAIVSAAMNGIISAVNSAQSNDRLLDYLHFDRKEYEKYKEHIISVIHSAWSVIELIDYHFDMEDDYKVNHYKPNRKTLKKISIDIGMPVEQEGVWEFLSAKRTSGVEAAFVVMLISITIGGLCSYSTVNVWGDYDSTGIWAGIIIGAMCWLFPVYDEGYDSENVRDYFLGRGGCVGLVMYIGLFFLYWPYKGIKYCLDSVKKD